MGKKLGCEILLSCMIGSNECNCKMAIRTPTYLEVVEKDKRTFLSLQKVIL